MTFPSNAKDLSRRSFLAASTALVAGIFLSTPIKGIASQSRHHSFSFYHTHTGETLNLNFNVKTRVVEKIKEFHHFLRDFRTGDIHPIDPRLLDILYQLQKGTNSSATFEVISGYRSPATNTRLHDASNRVAKKSLHMKGMAIDVRLSGVSTKTLRTIACARQVGGVGYYAKSDFIHLDTGRVRTW
ncbi:MAG: YcbK family protein [Desulforhopalus sp.]